MLTQDQLIDYAIEKVGVKYKSKPPYSLKEGFNCLHWGNHILSIAGKSVPEQDGSFSTFKKLVYSFKKLTKNDKIEYLDIALFYLDELETRHIGVMLNHEVMSHCSRGTNGVALSNVYKSPWTNIFQGFYRLK